MNTLGARLESARKRAGIKQTELARAVGKRQQTISKYEKGVLVPDLIELAILGQRLQIPDEELVQLARAAKKSRLPEPVQDDDPQVVLVGEVALVRQMCDALRDQVEKLTKAVEFLGLAADG